MDDPAFVMATGATPAWTSRNPRAQLTNVAQVTQQQTHPSLAGIGAWLRGDE